MPSVLLKEVRRRANLYSAWNSVRDNIMASGSTEFKEKAAEISKNPLSYLEKIYNKLRKNEFVFEHQKGILKIESSDKKRPLVIAPINNRIVQRALLNVLQNEGMKKYLGQIPAILNTETSVGGIPKKGVFTAIQLIKKAMKEDYCCFVKSDIKDFFTKIPKDRVYKIVLDQTQDEEFANFFRDALSTELANLEELKNDSGLFPNEYTGVPQGSCLSAFAGNIVLQEFDKTLNGREIITIRYIDDFVILGKSERSVKRAFQSANDKILVELGMEAYKPELNPNKASMGSISNGNGFDFLGCKIRLAYIAPSNKSKERLYQAIKDVQFFTEKAIKIYQDQDQKRRAGDAFAQYLTKIDRKIRGWGDAFAFCDEFSYKKQMDEKLNGILMGFINPILKKLTSDNLSIEQKRRMFGIALLQDGLVKDIQC